VKVVVVKKCNIAMLVVRLVNPLLGLSKVQTMRWMANAKYKWKVSVCTRA